MNLDRNSGTTLSFISTSVIVALVIGAIAWLLFSRAGVDPDVAERRELNKRLDEEPQRARPLEKSTVQIESQIDGGTDAFPPTQIEPSPRSQPVVAQASPRPRNDKDKIQQEEQLTDQRQANKDREPITALDQRKEHVTPLEEKQIKANAENRQLAQKIKAEIESKELVSPTTTTTDQKLNVEQTARDNVIQNKTSSLSPAISKASSADKDYIRALQGDIKQFITTKSQKNALENVGTEKVDYFNRIVISNKPKDSKSNAIATEVTKQLETLETTRQKAADKTDQAYIESLDPLEKQRSSESRFITVKWGDNLWEIAEKAYGDGFMYTRIFEANPQILRNPDLIYPGQVLRVPL